MNYMEHERYRWSYMTDEELERRLRRIKRIEKLHCFIYMAEQMDKVVLLELAKLKLKKVMNNIVNGDLLNQKMYEHRKHQINEAKRRVEKSGGQSKYGYEANDLDRYLDI